MAETSPAAPGGSTSEFKLALVGMILGALMDAAGGILHTLQDTGMTSPWFAIAIAVLGTITQVMALFGYTKSRTIIKAAIAASDAPTLPK